MNKKKGIVSTMKAQKLDFLYKSMVNGIIANLVAGCLLAIFLHPHFNNRVIVMWITAMAVFTLFRLLTYYNYIHSKDKPYRFYRNLFVIPMSITGALWAVAGIIFFNNDHEIYFMVLLCILGISMGSTIILSSIYYMTVIFHTIMLIPICINLILKYSSYDTILSALLIIYLTIILVLSIRIKNLINSNIAYQQLHKKNLEDLTVSENKFKTIFNNAPVGIFYIDSDYKIYDCNDTFCKVMDSPKSKLLNLNIKDIDDSRALSSIGDAMTGKLGYYEGEYITTFNKRKIWLNLSSAPVYNDKDEIIGVVGILQDRTDMQLAEEKVRHLAFHDSLTSLPNRILLKDRLKQALFQSRRYKKVGAILFLDLDDFKTINDTLGHHVGDLILKETADRLKQLLRTEDTISRIGGDEFVIILPSLNDTLETSTVSINIVSDRIHDTLKKPYNYMEKTIYTSTSIGVQVFNSLDDDIEELLKNADTAMYEAKKNGRGCTHFFNTEMNNQISRRLELENNLRIALEEDQFQVYFQPIYNGLTETLSGAETLIRWIHPIKGIIPPVEFIPIAEETGLIVEIGEKVIELACKALNEWDEVYNLHIPYISINLSINQFRDDKFISKIKKHINNYKIDPKKIVFEVTESQLISNFNFITSKMMSLELLGFKFALDDFGTGYSSLTYIKKLHMHVLKIDRSFIKDICNNQNDIVLVEAIISIANHFNMKIVAEGVEEKKQIEVLKQMGCKLFQGYYFSKPLPAKDFKILLKENMI